MVYCGNKECLIKGAGFEIIARLIGNAAEIKTSDTRLRVSNIRALNKLLDLIGIRLFTKQGILFYENAEGVTKQVEWSKNNLTKLS